jgi:UDP-2,3-diacylglucosamine hydrolase
MTTCQWPTWCSKKPSWFKQQPSGMELQAPSRWQCVDFISDLHLQATDQPTFSAWTGYMQSTRADAVFILGDLFEVWVGDDAALLPGSFEAECVSVLRHAGERLALFVMQGNRDFLMGPALMQACHATALADPSVLDFADQRWLLSHGDALCVDDLEYQAFRRQVRSADWQEQFLSRPLIERQDIARGIRQASASKKLGASAYADVDTPAALALLHANRALHLLHGHTHKPGQHTLAPGMLRTVLSDWDITATPPRAEVLRISRQAPGASLPVRLPAGTASV